MTNRETFEMSLPFVSCLCPTYRRPRMLANALGCFLAQEYPVDRRELIIMDDAGQYTPMANADWQLISFSRRFRSLPEKYNALAGLAQGDIIVVWEDDDIYLPDHLSAHVRALASGGFSKPSRVFSIHSGALREENAAGRFHGSMAFTRKAFERLGGWPLSRRGDFDQQFMSGLGLSGGQVDTCSTSPPSYVFRWGSTGDYHGSAHMATPGDENWYDKCKVDDDGNTQIRLEAHLDAETLRILKWWEEAHCNYGQIRAELQKGLSLHTGLRIECPAEGAPRDLERIEQPELQAVGSTGGLTLDMLFERAVGSVSDINEHCERLRELACECDHVTDFGMRPAVSTVALLAGQPGKVVSYNPWRYPEATVLESVVGRDAFEFKHGDSLSVEIDPTDLLFIDTKHTAIHLAQELEKHSARVKRWIVLHDTVIFGERGEDGGPGLLHAVRDFLEKQPAWSIQESHAHQYGLMVLVRRTE